jgi:lipoprotein signal peptidase
MRTLYRVYIVLTAFLLVVHLLISHRFSDVCTLNTGTVFGLLPDFGNSIFTVLGLAAVGAILVAALVFSRSIRHSHEYWLLVLTALAGFSNLIDRVVHGGICDYLRITSLVINLNDLVLTLNFVLILLILLVKHADHSRG